jgi:hypothetical protein
MEPAVSLEVELRFDLIEGKVCQSTEGYQGTEDEQEKDPACNAAAQEIDLNSGF